MHRQKAALWLVVLLLAAEAAPAQQPGTVVQLPTFSSFSVGTTVSVPDRGGVYLGGIGRAASGRSESGVPLLPFRSSAIGTARSASGAQVLVTIHDFDAMDQYLLSQPATAQPLGVQVGKMPQPRSAPAGPSWRLSPLAGAEGPPAASVADARAQRAVQQAARRDEALSFFERGRQAEADGKLNVARIYYQMAARRASGELKEQIAARLAAVSGATTAPLVVQGDR